MAFLPQGEAKVWVDRSVVSGAIRHDLDWQPAIRDVLAVAADVPVDEERLAEMVDRAMMRAVHAAHRTGTLKDLGSSEAEPTQPPRRFSAWLR